VAIGRCGSRESSPPLAMVGSAPLQQQPHHGGAAVSSTQTQGGTPSSPFPLVDGRPLVQQPPHHPHVALQQRRTSRASGLGHPGVEQARVLPHEPLHLTHVALPRSLARCHPWRLTLHTHSHRQVCLPALPWAAWLLQHCSISVSKSRQAVPQPSKWRLCSFSHAQHRYTVHNRTGVRFVQSCVCCALPPSSCLHHHTHLTYCLDTLSRLASPTPRPDPPTQGPSPLGYTLTTSLRVPKLTLCNRLDSVLNFTGTVNCPGVLVPHLAKSAGRQKGLPRGLVRRDKDPHAREEQARQQVGTATYVAVDLRPSRLPRPPRHGVSALFPPDVGHPHPPQQGGRAPPPHWLPGPGPGRGRPSRCETSRGRGP
jgi:hypothetical protein